MIKYHLLRVNHATLAQIISVIPVNNILSNRLQLHEINKFLVRIKRIRWMFREYIVFIMIYTRRKVYLTTNLCDIRCIHFKRNTKLIFNKQFNIPS